MAKSSASAGDLIAEGVGPDEGRFQLLLESLDAIVWELDVEGERFTYVSPQTERVLGYGPADWGRGPPFWSETLVHPEDRSWAVPFRQDESAAGRDHESTYRVVTADGRIVWVRDFVRVIYDASVKRRYLRGVMVDVTAEKEREASLQEQSRHDGLAADVGAAVAEGGSTQQILQKCAEAIVSRLDVAFARIWTLDEAGETLELQASVGLYTHLDGQHSRVPVGSLKIGRIAAERRPHLTNDVQSDARVSDPEWARREGMVSFAGYPLVAEGRLQGVVAVFARRPLSPATLDALQRVADRLALTLDRREAEAALRLREEQLAESQRLAHVGSWEWDVASGVVTWSDELYRIYGLAPRSEPCTFESYLARVHPDDRDEVRARIVSAYQEGREFEFEERIIRPDGAVRLLRSRGRADFDEKGLVVGLVGTCQDITEQRTSEERALELARVQAARDRAEDEERRMAFLAEAGAVLSSSLDYGATLKNLARLLVPRLADWCTIDLLEEGKLQRVITAHTDPAKERLASELAHRYPPDPNAEMGVHQVLRTGRSELVAEISPELIEYAARDPEHARVLRELNLHSYIVVPITGPGGTVGAITLVAAESRRTYAEPDLRFVEQLASRAALAIEQARLYRAAEESRARLEYQNYITRTITDNATAALFMMDERGCCTHMNRAAEAMTGYRLDEIRDIPLHYAIHHHRPDGTPYPIQECPIDRALPEDFSVRTHADVFFRKDGSMFPVLCAASPIFRDGVPVGTVVEVRDVTAEKQAQEALRASERQFRFLADAIPQQIWVTRPDGYHEYYNQRWYEYTGTTEEEATGEGWAKLLHPDDLERARDRWARSLRTGEPYTIEYRFRRADGQYRWFLGQALPQRDESGAILRWFGTLTDIQDRKEAESERERLIRELENERGRLHHIFQQAPAFIATLRGPRHVFETANPPYLQLVGHRQVIGRAVAVALPEVVEQGFTELLDSVYRTGEPFIGNEVPVLLQQAPDRNPEQRFVNFVYQPLIEADGSISGIFVHGVDVTDQVEARREVERKAEELARLAQALELSNRELDQFAYVASHDLKAPLRGIANLSTWIEEDLAGEISPEVKEHLSLLQGRVHRMEGLIEGILQYSRAGRVREQPELVDLRAVLGEIIDLLGAPEDVEFRLPEGLPPQITERLPLQQVLMNLLGNAVKYGRGDDARVEVTAADLGDSLELAVSDNGPGIAPEYHERIFGIFQTLHARDRVEGTGIGLSLVKKLVESRGGRVWVESEEGAGATFRFLWPKSPGEAGRA